MAIVVAMCTAVLVIYWGYTQGPKIVADAGQLWNLWVRCLKEDTVPVPVLLTGLCVLVSMSGLIIRFLLGEEVEETVASYGRSVVSESTLNPNSKPFYPEGAGEDMGVLWAPVPDWSYISTPGPQGECMQVRPPAASTPWRQGYQPAGQPQLVSDPIEGKDPIWTPNKVCREEVGQSASTRRSEFRGTVKEPPQKAPQMSARKANKPYKTRFVKREVIPLTSSDSGSDSDSTSSEEEGKRTPVVKKRMHSDSESGNVSRNRTPKQVNSSIATDNSMESGIGQQDDTLQSARNPDVEFGLKKDRVNFNREFHGKPRGEASWSDFKDYFERMATVNGWNEKTKLMRLRLCLRSQAESFVNNLREEEAGSYATLIRRLDGRFGDYTQRGTYITEAQLRKKKPEETYRAFGQAIETLCHQAMPGCHEACDLMSMQVFMENTEDPGCQLYIRQHEPQGLNDCIRLATYYERVVLSTLSGKAKKNAMVHSTSVVPGIPDALVQASMVNQVGNTPMSNQTRVQNQNRTKGSFQRQRSPREPQRSPQGQQPRRQRQPDDKCFNCGETGHWRRECPKPRQQQNRDSRSPRGNKPSEN
jgi:hypothetical protein